MGAGDGARNPGNPPEIRKMIYTTDAIESLHMQFLEPIRSFVFGS